jgi:hypothetical protein
LKRQRIFQSYQIGAPRGLLDPIPERERETSRQFPNSPGKPSKASDTDADVFTAIGF